MQANPFCSTTGPLRLSRTPDRRRTCICAFETGRELAGAGAEGTSGAAVSPTGSGAASSGAAGPAAASGTSAQPATGQGQAQAGAEDGALAGATAASGQGGSAGQGGAAGRLTVHPAFDIKTGPELYAAACQGCHMPGGTGASGGAGTDQHFVAAVDAGADAVLAASVFHWGELTIGQVKDALRDAGHEVR